MSQESTPDKSLSAKVNEWLVYITAGIALAVFILAAFPSFGAEITQNMIFLLIAVLVLLVFRHFAKIEIPGFIKVSKEVEEVKKDTAEIKSSLQSIAVATANSSIKQYFCFKEKLAEIGRDAEDVEKSLPKSTAQAKSPLANDEDKILNLIEQRNIVAAFAVLQDRLENKLRTILLRKGSYHPEASMSALISEAQNEKLIAKELVTALIVIKHGGSYLISSHPFEEVIPIDEAKKIANLGIKTLKELNIIDEKLKTPLK